MFIIMSRLSLRNRSFGFFGRKRWFYFILNRFRNRCLKFQLFVCFFSHYFVINCFLCFICFLYYFFELRIDCSRIIFCGSLRSESCSDFKSCFLFFCLLNSFYNSVINGIFLCFCFFDCFYLFNNFCLDLCLC